MVRRILVLAAAAALVAAACGNDDTTDDEEVIVEEEEGVLEEPETEDPEGIEPGPDGASLEVSEGELGEMLVDGDGMTLYIFTEDGVDESACEDACLDAWPPLLSDVDPTVGEGLEEGMVGTFERDDGTTQVSYNGHPLYYYVGDTAPGEMTGQDVESVWYVLDPDGEPIEGTAEDGDDTDDAEAEDPGDSPY